MNQSILIRLETPRKRTVSFSFSRSRSPSSLSLFSPHWRNQTMVHTGSSGSRKKKRKSVSGKEKDSESVETNPNKQNKNQKSASKGKKNKQQSQKKENPLEKLPFELVSEVSSLSLFLFDWDEVENWFLRICRSSPSLLRKIYSPSLVQTSTTVQSSCRKLVRIRFGKLRGGTLDYLIWPLEISLNLLTLLSYSVHTVMWVNVRIWFREILVDLKANSEQFF